MGLVFQNSAEIPLLGAYEVSFSTRRFVKFIGPGLLMSIAYVDPGNLESDLQVGANAGYALLWVLLWCTVLGYIIQMQAAKLGVVTRKHLAEHCREQFSPALRHFLWVMAEIAIIGSDIQEVIGSAIALLLLSHGLIPLWAGVLLSVAVSFTMLLVERWGITTLEGLFGILISVMVGSFAVMFYKARVPLGAVAEGFLKPSVPRPNIAQAVALVGSLIMPHNIYLHSALVQTRALRNEDERHKREALVYYGIESAMSLLVSVFINMFVTGVFAAGFYGQALQDIGLENAGVYLGNTYGTAMVYIWALGLLAAGQSSVMTGTYTGQFVMEGYLKLKISPWARIIVTRSVALVPALLVAVITRNDNGSTALDSLNQWLNFLQSVQLPFALIPVLAFNSSKTLMGKFANSRVMVACTVAISLLVMLVNVSGVLAFAEAALTGAGPRAWMLVAGGMVLYLIVVGYLFVHATAAAGILPPYVGGLADEPGGRSHDSMGGGRFVRVATSASVGSLLPVADVAPDETDGTGTSENDNSSNSRNNRASNLAGVRECMAPRGPASDREGGSDNDIDGARNDSAVGVLVNDDQQGEQQLRQPLLPTSTAAWQPSQ